MRVYIQKKGSEAKELRPGALIVLEGMSVATSGNTDSVSASVDALIDNATARKFITSINETPSTGDGSFLIEGSDCVSWSYTDKVIEDLPVEGSTVSGALLFTDMCPSCTTCESIYKLKYELENMKMWINTLKDVNLYTESVAQDRKTALSNLRITGSSSSCGVFPEDDSQLKATQLYKEYITMLHMWNYAVSINNASSIIQLAPENDAGFVVQTKRAVTSCDGSVRIKCEIKVEKSAYLPASTAVPPEYSVMSLYVPEDSMKFTYGPFAEETTPLKPGNNPGFEDLSKPVCELLYPTANPLVCTSKKVRSTSSAQDGFLNVQKAGTYTLEAKFLPFIPSESKINGQLITPENWKTITTNVDPTSSTDVQGGTTYTYAYDLVTNIYEDPVVEPTRTLYLISCIAPSAAVDLSIVWNITITWTIQELVENAVAKTETETQTYMYKCNAVSTPCSDTVSIGGTTIYVPPESEDEDDNNG